MDYTAFNTEDFLLDPFFTEWAMDGRHDDFWQKFMAENPDREALVQQARLIVLAARTLPVAPLKSKLRTEMWENVRQKMAKETALSHVPGSGWHGAWRWAAAVVILTAGLLGWQLSKPGNTDAVTYEKLVAVAATNHPGLVEHVNRTGKVLPVRLPDGSAVLLQSKSRISYSESDFGISKREVYISGEAFFEVAKNPEKPFFVYANELVTRVLGTSFTVRAYPDDKQVNVAVRTGTVSVFTQATALKARNHDGAEPEVTVLMPNQQVTLERGELKLSKTLVNQLEMLPAHDSPALSFKFEEELVSVIFEKLEKTYGIEIAYNKALLAGCKITASLNDEPLYEKVSLICQGLGGATYEVIDARIVIHSYGCN